MNCTVVAAGLALILVGTPVATWAQAEQPKPVTLELKEMPARDALVKLLKQAKVQYIVNADVSGKVSVYFKDLPFETALKLLLQSGNTRLTYAVESGVYIIRAPVVGMPVHTTEPVLLSKAVPPKVAPAPLRISLDTKEMPFRTVLDYIFTLAKKEYQIDDDVPQEPVTVRVMEESFEETLRQVLYARKIPLTYVIENGVYIIQVRHIIDTSKPAIPPPAEKP